MHEWHARPTGYTSLRTHTEGPGRRNSIAVRFSCESCGPVGYLRILQHKGETLLSWEDSPR